MASSSAGMPQLSASPRDKAAVLAEAAVSVSERERLQRQQQPRANSSGFSPAHPTANGHDRHTSVYTPIHADSGKKSNLSVLMHDRSDNLPIADSRPAQARPSMSGPQQPSPIQPQEGSMLHAVSAFQHALLAAAVALQGPASSDAPTPLSSVNTGGAIGNHVFAGRIMGTIDLVAFHTCIQALVNRHPALRTSFQQIESTGRVSGLLSPPDLSSATTDWQGVAAGGEEMSGLRFAQMVHPSDAVAADFRHTSVTLDGGDAYTPMSELTSLRPEHLPPTLANMVERAAYEPFGVTENASLFRVRLIQILGDGRKSRIPVKGAPQEKEECTLFVFALSALVGDIWSMTVLLDDFRVLYAGSLNMPHIDLTIGPSGVMSPETRDALAEMSETVLEPLVMDYSVYSEWQRARLLGTSGADDLLSPISQAGATLTDQATRFSAFWSEVMSGTLPVLSLPNLVERPRMNETPAAEKDGAITLPSFASVPFVIPAALTKRLIALATSERTELNSLLISAFQLFLFRYTGQDDVLLGGQASCRANLETQNVVGPFSNTVLYRSNTSGNHIFRTYLQSTRQQIIGVRAHSDYPMTLLLQRLLSSQQITSSTALFPTLGSNSLFAASFDFEYPESSRFQDNLVYTVAAFASAVHGPSTHVGGLRLQPLELPCSNSLVTPFDAAPLAVRMSEVGGEMRGQLRYDARTYKEDLMRRMTSHWEQLLSNIVINPDVKVSDLNLLNSIERNLLLHDWNQTSTIHSPAQWQHNPSRARLIHQWFESQATLTPESCAIEYIDPVTTLSELWTYRQLNERANQLAHYLRYLGVQPDQPVPIVLDRSPKLVLSLLAVLKAGAAAMPLDPTVPSERIKFLVHQSEAVLVISETTHFIRLAGMYSRDRLKFNGVNKDLIAECRKKEEENQDEQKEDGAAQLSLNLSSHSVYLLNLDLEMHLIRSGNTQNLPSNIQPSATAYVLFTSGSTGVPKGCMLTHANLLNYITWFVAEYGIVPTDRAAHIANMAFDASMMETWPTLCRGGCIVQGANDDIKLVPSKLVTWMHAHRVTFTFLTTQLCHQFLEASYPADFTLRYLFTGGDRLQRGAREEAKFALVNVYGPTESTINVTVHTVPGGTVQPPPIGRPIANTQLYIVDAYMQPVPLGICGELMIGGLGVGRGYFNRPDLTAEKFIPNPFYHISPSSLLADDASKAGSKVSSSDHDPSLHSHSPLLYRTGDLVRYRSSGLLEFVGRQDQQVKIRGYRIEMAEIESAFLAHPIVSEICVVVTTQEKEKKLLAYVVTRDAKKKHHEQEKKAESDSTSNKIPSLLPPAIPYQEFKKFLREKIPSYMIPSALLYLEFMPLTNNGKVHRAILPVPDWNDEGVLRTLGQTSSDTYVPAVTPIEKLVVRIVRQLLNIPKQKRISLQDNFFDIGGHSLSIGQLISKIDARVGLELHYSKVFESSSLGALTKTITVMLGTKASTIELAEEEMEEEFAEHHMASPPPLSKNIHPTTETVRPSASPAVVSVSPGLNRSTSGSTSADSTQGNGELKRPSPSQQQIVKTDSSAPPSFQFKVDSAQVYPLSQNGPLPKFQVRTNTPYRLSYNQSSLLFLSELDPSGLSSLAYNIPFVARLHSGHGTWGAKNEDALRKTFATLVERHTALRTVFPKRSKEPSITVDASTDTLQTPQMNGRSLPTHSPRNGSTAGMAADEENLVLLSAADLAAGVAHQIVLDVNEACAALDWETIDGVSKGWTERDVKRYCIDQTYRTFDLNRGPIMRVRLIHYLAEQSSQSNAGSRSTSRSKAVVAAPVQEQHTMLLWTVHHIAVDLWSMVILIEEMKTLYAWNLAHMGDKAGSQALVHCPHLTPSPQLLQYIHCIPAQLGILQGAKAEKLWSYWLNQLAEPLPTLSMPTDKVRPAKQTYNGTSYTFPIPLRLHTALTGLAREEGVTMYTLLLSAFYTLLHVYSGQEDLIVGSPLACRNDAARENVVGYFVNPLPLRSNLGGNPSFRSYVSRVKQVVLGALSHQDLPLPVLAQRLLQGKERDASRTPIWQVLFILQKPHRQFLAEQGLAMFFMNAPGVEMNLGSQLHMESVQIGAVDDEEPTAAAAGMNGHHLSPQKAQINSKPSASMGGAGGQRHAQFDLALICGETHRELCGAFHFNTDVYQLDTIRRMSEHFVTLLESIVANPSAKLSSLNVLPAREKEALLSDWCTTTPYDKSKLIHQLVEAQVVARPDALAICGKDEQHKEVEQRVTFSQMNSRANQLASYLRFAGVNLETPMFVLMNRTPLFIITLLACLKSGGSYVPIDPSYPKQRIEHIMEQAEASAAAEASAEQEPMSPLSPEPPRTTGTPDGFALVLCERSLAEKVPALVGGKSRFKLLFIDELEAEVKQYGNPHNLPLLEGQTSSSCMSMVFTSGSTGKPKGVQVMHKGLHSYCAWWNPYLQSGPHDRVSHLANVGFDASMTETWATLVAGASIFLCSEEIIRLTPKLFIEWVTQHEITVAFLPTVLTEAFVSEQHPPEMKLRCLYTGGDKLHIGPRADARFRLICCYGPCESTIGVTATDVPAGMTAPPFNIGKPQPNVQIHILDPNQKLLPIGTIGEICIGGQQLARGYYNRPDLTRNAFIQNPFKKSTVSSTAMNTNNIVDKHASDASASSGDSIDSYSTSSVLYRTGDLARYLHDGSLEFWGRADFQVKIRGNRIELGEIEGAMRECEGIYDVVVVARTDAKQGNKAVEGEKKIVCYYVWKRSLAPNQQLDSSALRAMLRAKLPEFMIPSAFVNLPALPLTPNGKVDRDALPAPSMDDLATRAHLAPRNEIEEQLAGIVTHLLGVPKVGMQDSFFDLGGHSLAAAQLLGRVRETFGVDLPLSKIFDTASMGGLAEAIETLRAAPSTEARASLVPTIPGTPGSVHSAATPLPQSGLMNQRSALLAARMKVPAGAVKALPSPQSTTGVRAHPSSPSRGGGSESPSVASEAGKDERADARMPKLSALLPAGSPRLGSSPSRSSGLANFLAQKSGQGASSSRAVGMGSSYTPSHTTPTAAGGLAVPFAAPTLGFTKGQAAMAKLTTSNSISDDDSDEGKSASPYQRLNFLGHGLSSTKHGRSSSVAADYSGASSPASSLISSSPRGHTKRLAKLRSDTPNSTENSARADSRTGSRRNSVSALGAPSPAPEQLELQPGDAPMTYSQASLWFVNKLDPHGVTYTCVFGVELLAPFDAKILEDALYGLLLRHPSLRTRFLDVNDEPVQRVVPPEQAKLDFERRSILQGLGHDAEERVRHPNETEEEWQARVKKAWKKLLMQENHIHFNVTTGPVFRARLFTVDPEANSKLIPGISHGILHLMAHHIAVDGWSMELLMNELFVLYSEIYRHRHEAHVTSDSDAPPSLPPPLDQEITECLAVLPPVTHTMADRAAQERALLASPDGDRCWNFWQRTLAPPLTLLEVHTDFPRPPIQTYKGDVFHFKLPADTISGLRSLAKQEKVTMFMTLISSFMILLHRYTGQEDLCIGTPMACRTDMAYERTVGHFVNPVVLRANLTGDLTTLQLLDNVKRMTINAFVNQDLPFPLLVDRLQSFRDSSRNPLFQVLFSLNQKFQQGAAPGVHKEADGMKDASELHVSPLADLDQLVSPFDLQLIMTETEQDLKADLTYNTSLFTHETMRRMSLHLLELWKGMCSNPTQKISLIKMLPKSEYDLIVTGFNQPRHELKDFYIVDVPKPDVLNHLMDPERAVELKLRNRYDKFELLSAKHCVHRLFELQTRLTPAATAVVEYESFRRPASAAAAASAKKTGRPAALFPAQSVGPQIFSYAKLNARANSLAHYMREALNVRVGDVVVLLFYRCADWLAAMLAALKCGAAYVPVDPAYPADRITFMMQDAKAKVLLTHSRAMEVLQAINPMVAKVAAMDSQARITSNFKGVFPPQLAETNSSVVMVDVQWDDISLFDTINPEVGVTLQHLCYLVYTCLVEGTLVARFDGAPVPVEQITKGMRLVGAAGQPVVAKENAQAQQVSTTYVITTAEGDSYEVSENHQITVLWRRPGHVAFQGADGVESDWYYQEYDDAGIPHVRRGCLSRTMKPTDKNTNKRKKKEVAAAAAASSSAAAASSSAAVDAEEEDADQEDVAAVDELMQQRFAHEDEQADAEFALLEAPRQSAAEVVVQAAAASTVASATSSGASSGASSVASSGASSDAESSTESSSKKKRKRGSNPLAPNRATAVEMMKAIVLAGRAAGECDFTEEWLAANVKRQFTPMYSESKEYSQTDQTKKKPPIVGIQAKPVALPKVADNRGKSKLHEYMVRIQGSGTVLPTLEGTHAEIKEIMRADLATREQLQPGQVVELSAKSLFDLSKSLRLTLDDLTSGHTQFNVLVVKALLPESAGTPECRQRTPGCLLAHEEEQEKCEHASVIAARGPVAAPHVASTGQMHFKSPEQIRSPQMRAIAEHVAEGVAASAEDRVHATALRFLTTAGEWTAIDQMQEVADADIKIIYQLHNPLVTHGSSILNAQGQLSHAYRHLQKALDALQVRGASAGILSVELSPIAAATNVIDSMQPAYTKACRKGLLLALKIGARHVVAFGKYTSYRWRTDTEHLAADGDFRLVGCERILQRGVSGMTVRYELVREGAWKAFTTHVWFAPHPCCWHRCAEVVRALGEAHAVAPVKVASALQQFNVKVKFKIEKRDHVVPINVYNVEVEGAQEEDKRYALANTIVTHNSGSTGRPKGVMISHRSMYLIAKWHQLEYQITEVDRVTQQTAPAFDPVGFELWPTWLAGASLHIVPDSVRGNPPALQQFMLQTHCTIAFMPTPICANMIDEPWPADSSNIALRVLTTGGDRLVRGPLPGNPLPPHLRFDNLYGPSENTIVSTYFTIPPGFDGAPPIGRVVDNVRIYIVDKHMKPVPIGVPGEIYVAGDCLATGYLNRPDLTAEKFRPDIFLLTDEELAKIAEQTQAEKRMSPSPPALMEPVTPQKTTGRPSMSSPTLPKSYVTPAPAIPSYPRMYESGDSARWLPDGTIEFIGRKDFQVKIRGFRIELGEIETSLAKHARVSKCIVQVKSKGQGHQALAAYVVLTTTGAKMTESAMVDELRSFVKQTLPEYMVPSVFVFLARLPETANGKIDLKALPEPVWNAGGGAAAAATIVEPRNEIEVKLCSIWCALLQLSTISIHDNFFELGGNSLTAARLLSAIKREMGVELNVSLLFHAPTVAGVSEKIAFMREHDGSLANYVPTSAAAPERAATDGSVSSTAKDAPAPSTTELDAFDPKKEIVLDASICNPRFDHRHMSMSGASKATDIARVSPTLHHPRALFLTGVTGFLGVHLLVGLLSRTDAKVYCLIRMAGGETGTPMEKILKNIAKFKLIDLQSDAGQKAVQRIVPVLGDLSAVRLGIAAQQWSALSTSIDGIFHCGAFVNSVLPYSQLKAANVGGTHEVLRLATSGGRLKPVHHISTLSVFQASYPHKITELEPITADGLSTTSGYPTSKFVADSLILMAAKRGLPVAIYRPGRITGHSKTGLTSLDDFFTRLLKGCIQLGAFPDLDWLCDLTPVDWMANSIVQLATHPHPLPTASMAETTGYPLQPCGVYHLHQPKPIHWMKLCEWLIHTHKYACKILPYTEWLAKLQAAADAPPTSASPPLTPGHASTGIPRIPALPNVLAPLMTVFGPTKESMGTVAVMPQFNSKYTCDAIVKAKYANCPEPNQELLHTYFTALNKIGFM